MQSKTSLIDSSKWLKAVRDGDYTQTVFTDTQTMILERASKLAFVDPEEDSEYGRAWAKYFLLAPANPQLATPPAWLDQPKYRCPKDYAETKLALDQLKSNLGVEGIFPVDRRRNAEIDGAEEPQVTPHIIAIVRSDLVSARQELISSIISSRRQGCSYMISTRRTWRTRKR